MNTFDYQFVFDDIVDGYSKVKLIYRKSKSISFDISIGDAPIRLLSGKHISSLQADLLDLAIAIHFADKLAIPKKSRSIHVNLSLPLRHPDTFTENSSIIHDILFWYTKDYWHLQFQPRKSKQRESECHIGQLNLSSLAEFEEFALWSGGLDSLAGLQTRLLNSKGKRFSLIGTGSNKIMRKTQQQVFQSLHYLPHASGRLRFLHVPIHAKYGRRYSQNQSHRARGIVFLLIGAVCALSTKCNKLHIYETGIGAINLPLPGGVGRDHSKAVHPISLFKISNFISNVIKESFLIENPFIFSTKAEMCALLKYHPHLIFETISCDRLHREKYIQCGFCSSCLLRQQAIVAAGIKDKTKYLIPHGKRPQERHLSYWKLMNRQIYAIEKALSSQNPFFDLDMSYSNDLRDIIGCMDNLDERNNKATEEGVVRLYKTYVWEWQRFANIILDHMTHGNYHDHYLEDEKWQQMQLLN